MKFESTLEAEAARLIDVQDWAGACDALARARRRSPDSLNPHILGVDALIRAYRFEEAFELAATLENRFGGKTQADTFLAELDARQGRWLQAIERYERIASKSGLVGAQKIAVIPTYRQSIFNAHGILDGADRLPAVPHEPNAETSPGLRRYVFVSGMPRAGTTALGHLINANPDAALFVELHNPYLTYSPASFLPSVVERRRLTLPAAAPEKVMARASQATFVGDKRPLFHYSLAHTVQIMGEEPVSVFHILRNPLFVAESYQRRAENPDDAWDPLRDLGNCIDELNVMHRFIIDWDKHDGLGTNHRLVYVDYERAFRDVDYILGLFETAGIRDTKALWRTVNAFIERSRDKVDKVRKVSRPVLDAVSKHLDHEAASAASVVTGIDCTIKECSF